jgi:hypothetical protein
MAKPLVETEKRTKRLRISTDLIVAFRASAIEVSTFAATGARPRTFA